MCHHISRSGIQGTSPSNHADPSGPPYTQGNPLIAYKINEEATRPFLGLLHSVSTLLRTACM